MQIVATERADDHQIHRIDVWFSERRRVWMVERLDADGHLIGLPHQCASEEDAADCLAVWLRSHDHAHPIAPDHLSTAERRILKGQPRRRAA